MPDVAPTVPTPDRNGSGDQNDTQVVRADPDLGRTLATLAGASTLAVIAVGELVRSYFEGLEELTATDPAAAVDAAATAVRMGMATIAATMAAASLLLARAAARIASSGRYPAPGSRVLRDTPVVFGRRARYRAVALALAAAAILACAAYTAVTGAGLADSLIATSTQA